MTGIVSQDARAPEGGYEIKGKNLKIYNIAGTDYPIGEYQSEELLLDKRHLAMRMRKMVAMAKIRATVLDYSRRWFMESRLDGSDCTDYCQRRSGRGLDTFQTEDISTKKLTCRRALSCIWKR